MASQHVFADTDFCILFSSNCENTVVKLNPVYVGNFFSPKKLLPVSTDEGVASNAEKNW